MYVYVGSKKSEQEVFSDVVFGKTTIVDGKIVDFVNIKKLKFSKRVNP